MDLFSDIPKKENLALSVTQLVKKMKRAIESGVGKLWVEGEVSNLKKQDSGHWYFSLKDEGSQIQCAIFNARRKDGSEYLEDGLKVRVFAESTIYEPRGQLQVIVEKIESSGLGALQAKFEALKRKLMAEGLFYQDRKQAIPRFPQTIGIVTSPTGAAIQDILNILRRRSPWVQPVLYPVRVQGKGVEMEIASAIRKLNDHEVHGYPRCDLLIVGRGGGSLEDLWAFNEEVVARAIAASAIPVISAVGHEIDFTIADFVADLRAPTPSAAAELAAPDIAELDQMIAHSRKRMGRCLTHSLREPAQRVDQLCESLAQLTISQYSLKRQTFRELQIRHNHLHPSTVMERKEEKLQALHRSIGSIGLRKLLEHSNKLESLKSMIRALGPVSAFHRGFSITMTEDGKILRSIEEVEPDTQLRTKFIDGEIRSVPIR
ncbi:MAG: hypothetical protein RL346_746 [Verrucomicrobiota bacterium]